MSTSNELGTMRCMTQESAAWVLGIDSRHLRRLKDAPRDATTGKYNAADLVAWWLLAKGVSEALIDRQLGHSSATENERRSAAWSVVGRKFYTYADYLTLDARRSAEAVRELLDQAETELLSVAHTSALVDGPRTVDNESTRRRSIG